MMHVMNPLIERHDGGAIDVPFAGRSRTVVQIRQFVSCACGWHQWIKPTAWGSKDDVWFPPLDAENLWIDHMEKHDPWE